MFYIPYLLCTGCKVHRTLCFCTGYTLHLPYVLCAGCTVHCTMFSVRSAYYTVPYTIYGVYTIVVRCTSYHILCTGSTVSRKVYAVHCTAYHILCTGSTVSRTYTGRLTVYGVPYTMYGVPFAPCTACTIYK